MAQKNKFSVIYARMINQINVSRRRNIELKINYLKGLVIAYRKDAETYLKEEVSYVESIYNKKLEPLQNQLNGKSLNEQIREKKLEHYDKRTYWNRRKYKTSMLRKQDESAVEDLLKAWDHEEKVNREQYILTLNNKWPHQDLQESEKNVLKEKINALEVRKTSQLKRIQHRYERKLNRLGKFEHHNERRLNRMIEINKKLAQSIIDFSKMRHKEDERLIKETESKLKILSSKSTYKPFEQKRMKRLNRNSHKIRQVMSLLEHDDIHLSIGHLKMFFGGVRAVNDLSFDVKRGEIFGLIGPNGAGKTTVFNCITQFYKATDGQIIFRNKEDHIVDLREFKTHHMINEGIARSFQNVELIWELTVLDNLLVAAHSLIITNFFDHMLHTPKWKREELVLRTKGLQILQDLDIMDYAFRSPYGLPYGILKKVELARTLMTNPSLIILDEPAAGLNDVETEELARVIKKINKDYQITIFLVEHDMGLVMSICDRICAISFGKRIGLGTPKEIQENPEVRKAYLGDDTDE